MSLLKQWQKKHLQLPANAIPAIPASNEGESMRQIAKIAEIAIATPPEALIEHSNTEAKKNEWKRKGLSDAEAGEMEAALIIRDRLLDNRRTCIECQHSYMRRCKAGLRPVGESTIYSLHRCKGFIEG